MEIKKITLLLMLFSALTFTNCIVVQTVPRPPLPPRHDNGYHRGWENDHHHGKHWKHDNRHYDHHHDHGRGGRGHCH